MGVFDKYEVGREEEQQPSKKMPPRVQSPSSILTYKQCPRKYYYRYIAKLPSTKTIHLVRGSIVHKVLENFYDANLKHIPDASFPVTAKVLLHELFQREWKNAERELEELKLSPAEIEGYFEETKIMITNFFHYLMDKLKQFEQLPLGEGLALLKPKREIELISTKHHVRGFADAIHEQDGKTYVLDYKTSSKAEITPDYHLQLSIYGMILAEIAKQPDEVGIFFLKQGREIRLPMTERMAEYARIEVEQIHEFTATQDPIDYPLKPGPLCKWSTGQCDYYDLCFGNKKISDFVQVGERRK